MSETPRTSLRVLLVDDSPVMGVLLKAWLDRRGHELVSVHDHFEHLLESPNHWQGTDVLLCDLALDTKTAGEQILAYALEHYPRIRRICITGSRVENVQVARALSHDFLYKPSDVDDIVKAIEG